MIRIHFVLCILLGFASLVTAQNSAWQEDLKKAEGNIYNIQQKFIEEWSNKEVVKGHGYKQFQRWMDFMEPRCFPSGEKFAPDALQKAIEDNPGLFENSQNGNWTYVGNTSVPAGNKGGKGAGRINMVKEFPNQPGVWYACAPSGGLWRSNDSGAHWTVMGTDNLSGIGVHDVAMDPTNSSILYIASGDADAGTTYSLGLLKSTDAGQTWNTTGLSFTIQEFVYTSRIIVSSVNPNLIHVATNTGLYRSTDGASTFSIVLSGNMREVHHSMDTTGTMFALDNNSGYFRSTDEGMSWSLISSGLPSSGVTRMALAQSSADPDYIYIIATGLDYGLQGIYRSTDEGLSFVQVADAFPNTLSFEVFGTETGGQGWYDLAICCDPSDPLKVYTGGIHIWKTEDGGTTWICATDSNNTPFLPYIHADIHSINFIPGQTNMLVGSDGGVSLYNGNASIDASGDLAIAQVRSLNVFRQNENMIISGSQDTGINLKNGSFYTHEINGDGMECLIHPELPDIMYAAIQNGQIHKSSQGSGYFDVIVNSGGTGVNENGSFYTPFQFGNTPEKIFVAKSKVYKSVNSGETFTAMAGFGAGPIRKLAVAPSNENVIYASKNNSLYKSINGNNFSIVIGTPNMFISDIEVSEESSDKVWITFSGFNANAKVYYSENAGLSWTNLSTGLPNIPVNCIISQNGIDGGIYIGTDLGVFYRDNELGSWIPFQSNLPNTLINDLEVNYETGKLFAATYGRGIWSSSLYTLPSRDISIREILQPSGMVCQLDFKPKIVIRNEGQSTITSATIEVSTNSGYVETFVWTGSLQFGDTVHVVLDAITLADYGFHTLTSSVIDVNGQGSDVYALNNIKSSTFEAPGPEFTIPVELHYKPLCSADGIEITIQDYFGNIEHSFEPMLDYIDMSTNFCMADGCYILTIDGNSNANFCDSEGGYLFNIDSNHEILSIPTNVDNLDYYPFCIGDVAYGCMNDMACNYDPMAEGDDGSCIFASGLYEFNLTTDSWGDETTWNIIDENNVAVASVGPVQLSSFTTYQWLIPLDSGCYTFQLFDGFGDGIFASHGGDFSLYSPQGNLLLDFTDFGYLLSYNFCEYKNIAEECAFITGCMDPLASNYEPDLLIDDGSCIYPGCMDILACNYLDTANLDDGSCTYPGCSHINACNYDPLAGCDSGICDYSCLPPCPGDFDHSLSVSVSDFIFFLSWYGCVNSCGDPDLDQNGAVNIADLLTMITYLGNICPN